MKLLKTIKRIFKQTDGFPLVAKKLKRNDPCQCGSGKKQKKCCGTKTRYFFTRYDLIKNK